MKSEITFVRQKQVFSKFLNCWFTCWFEVKYASGKRRLYKISRPQSVINFCDKACLEKRAKILDAGIPTTRITVFYL